MSIREYAWVPTHPGIDGSRPQIPGRLEGTKWASSLQQKRARGLGNGNSPRIKNPEMGASLKAFRDKLKERADFRRLNDLIPPRNLS